MSSTKKKELVYFLEVSDCDYGRIYVEEYGIEEAAQYCYEHDNECELSIDERTDSVSLRLIKLELKGQWRELVSMYETFMENMDNKHETIFCLGDWKPK